MDTLPAQDGTTASAHVQLAVLLGKTHAEMDAIVKNEEIYKTFMTSPYNGFEEGLMADVAHIRQRPHVV